MADTSWDTIDRYMVLSSDAHAGAETHQYRDYLRAAGMRTSTYG